MTSSKHLGDNLDLLVAEIASSVYAVALRHGRIHSWLDLQLDVWTAVAETVENWRRELSHIGALAED